VISSTSDSRTAAAALLALLCALLGFCLALELAARTIIPHLSSIEGRQAADQRSALSLEPHTPGGATGILMVGNSLLQAGVDRGQLQQLMAPDYRVVLLPIENTTYWDWYFGLRRLFAAGSRPAVVVVSLNAQQMLSNATDGERFAHSLMRLRDLPRVARASALGTAAASDYFFANLSAWLGLRAAARNALLQKWLPGAAQLVRVLTTSPGPRAAARSYDADPIVTRLAALEQLTRSAGAEFIFLVPPAPQQNRVWATVRERAASDGVRTLLVSAPQLGAADYPDGAHLNARGASLFTAQLGPALRSALDPQ
jgi:hypothetical protein